METHRKDGNLVKEEDGARYMQRDTLGQLLEDEILRWQSDLRIIHMEDDAIQHEENEGVLIKEESTESFDPCVRKTFRRGSEDME